MERGVSNLGSPQCLGELHIKWWLEVWQAVAKDEGLNCYHKGLLQVPADPSPLIAGAGSEVSDALMMLERSEQMLEDCCVAGHQELRLAPSSLALLFCNFHYLQHKVL